MPDPRPINEIAEEIQDDWKNVWFGAKPYLVAMTQLTELGDYYGYDSAREILLYFLANAQTWRGPVARRIKLEINKMLKEESCLH